MKSNIKIYSNLLLFISIAFLCNHSMHAQKKSEFKYALEFSSDNDAFVIWENHDRYYTFGIGIKMYVKTDHFLGLEKLFSEKQDHFMGFEIRSEGYTPETKGIEPADIQDDDMPFERPFAGLLYGNVESTYIFKRSFIKTTLLLGVMGPSAFAKEIQDWFHDKLPNNDRLEGWEYQIPDQIIFNVNMAGAYDFLPNSTWFDAFGMAEARLGNLYVDATTGLGLRIGLFDTMGKSSGFGNNILNTTTGINEFYLKSVFSTTFAAFNGTAQGNMFDNSFPYVLDSINHFHATMSHGIYFNSRRFTASYENVFNYGKVISNSRHIYGRIKLMYRF